MKARLLARLRNEPIVGLIVLTLAAGFLLGVLAANVRDSSQVATESVAGAGSTDVSAGDAATGVGEATGTGGSEAGTAGGTVPAAGGATTRGATAGPGGATGTTPNIRGVTDDKIKLGIACIDLSVLKNVPQYDAGDQQKEFESVVDGWKRARLLPVHGRNIELTFRCFNVLSPEDQRATAVELVQDKKVFSVVAHCCFKDGSEVVAGEMRTPVVSVDSVLDSSYQRGAPFLFTAGVALETEARNFVQWLKEQNLAGKKVGVYYLQDQYGPAVAKIIQAELAKLGNTGTVLFSTDNQVGGPNDSLAVQRFNAERVEVVVLMTSANGFTQAAGTQRYKPQYVQADFGLPTLTDTSTTAYDADNFDGALGMTQQRVGEWRRPPLAKATQECQDNYFKYAGQRIDGPSNESTWGALLYACDVMNLTFQAIQKAGRDLTPQSFVTALQTVSMEGARFGGLAYSPTKHDGATSIRTIKWTKDCKCFRVQGPFRPFYVP